ncbi:signal transduction histidine kinase [Paenibacillus rhizosphaerae]|uniref:histidine kinase n=1 Tax=Paenibacillus rhizosphaerae TaxID=297318 RepID=A0A839U045_9BACL|nr:HAMP domain-containing sensor histidine kinase [Paenibacillus rhizosphaerae]MBB3131018.1 signal transduction histidine kinase [Paenibacillus rhizosphaerae]
MWVQIFAVLLLLVCMYLVFQHRHLLQEIKRITGTTEAIRAGNLNLRYRLHRSRKPVQDLGGELNRLLDDVQQTFERTQFLEDERKRMIASISHDLRTPLTSLLGYMEALRDDMTLTAEEKRSFIGIASDKGDALLERLQEFFELAKLEADDSPAELHKMNLTDIVQEVLLGFYPDFQKAGLTPTLRIPDSPQYVKGDRLYIRRILENLVSNALRYGQEGKEIGIAIREETDFVWVDVWDRGKGISSQDLPRVFERFYTGMPSRNASLRGTGLGLTITKNLVEKQGGQISVSSKPGEKTMFSFSLLKD